MHARGPSPIVYSIGNEHNPTDPFGRVHLRISPSGTAALENVSRRGRRAWRAMVRPESMERLQAALIASGFPAMPLTPAVPDAAIRVLTVGPVTAYVSPEAAKLPGYVEVFGLLDAIADEISGGTVGPRRRPGPSVVSSIERS